MDPEFIKMLDGIIELLKIDDEQEKKTKITKMTKTTKTAKKKKKKKRKKSNSVNPSRSIMAKKRKRINGRFAPSSITWIPITEFK